MTQRFWNLAMSDNENKEKAEENLRGTDTQNLDTLT